MRWSAGELADLVGGELSGPPDTPVEWATQDSRLVGDRPNALFVPLVAARDGHDFVPAAFAAGATVSLTDRRVAGSCTIRVADTSAALSRLGSVARDRLANATVIGITGSVGKTTTKDLLMAILVLGTDGERIVHANALSFNNEIGVPLTLLSAPDDAEIVLVEMGARGKGHIAALCRVARPTVGIVTNVGKAHTAEFGSIEAVAQAKGELIEALPANGLAVLNADDARVLAMAGRTDSRVVTFGAGGVVRAEQIRLTDDLRPRFHLVSPWGNVEVDLGVAGAHLVADSLAAAATALALGVDPRKVASALVSPVVSPMRMALGVTSSGARVLDDSYNANPMSVEGALHSLAALGGDRRIAVLGVMAELGDDTVAEHVRMAELASDLGIEVIAVDAEAFGSSVTHVDSVEDVLMLLVGIGVGDVVLVKGSRVAGLERLADALLAL